MLLASLPLLLAMCLRAQAKALPSPAESVQMETDITPGPTPSWIIGPPAGAGEVLQLTVMMRHSEKSHAKLHKALMEVSDPDSEMYGQHMTNEQLAKLAPIADEDVQTVRDFFDHSGVLSLSANPNADILTVSLTAAAAAELFGTVIHRFQHARKTRLTLLRAAQPYFLPANVAAVVATVGDLLHLPRVTETLATSVDSTSVQWDNGCSGLSCPGLVTPSILQQRYKLPVSASAAAGNGMAVAEFQGQYFKKTDLTKFSSGCAVNVTVDTVVGGDEQEAGVEAELDIEYIKGLAPEVPLTVVYQAEYSLLKWVNSVSSMQNAPQVHSVSYGNDEKQQTGLAYMDSCNAQFMKAGLKGLSILFASGDQGVCGREGCGFLFWKRFKPDFPAASPYITAVGGTDFSTKGVVGEETAWTAGGGGFSDTFGIPDYQASQVAAYKANKDADLPPQKMWNNTGRGYPDVSALGGQKNSYCVVTSGEAQGVAGTSASCPVTASVFARLNGARLAAGKPVLGFLNPWIYKNADAFQDVTSGKNTGGGTNTYGFTAVTGWDPATGVGTPNYEEMVKRI